MNKLNMEDLRCLAIVTDKNIKSIRDLTTKHILMLENIYNIGLNTIKKEFDIDDKYIRVYLHYHPHYWWLHVHFTHVNVRQGALTERAYKLD